MLRVLLIITCLFSTTIVSANIGVFLEIGEKLLKLSREEKSLERHLRTMTDTQKRTLILYTAYTGDVDITEKLLKSGVPVDSLIKGSTPLIMAARKGHLAIIKLLLEHEATIDMRDINGATALMNAVKNGNNIITAQYLIEQGADIHALDQRHNTPLIIATYQGNPKILQLLLDQGANINAKNNNGNTALIFIARRGHLQAAELLINRGADINAKNQKGGTAIREAAIQEQLEMAKLLILSGAEYADRLPIYAKNGYLERVKILIEAGANINVKHPRDGRTALVNAAKKGYVDIAKYLLNKGADSNSAGNDGWAAINMAAYYGFNEILHLLIQQDADINHGNKDGWTPLMSAADKKHATTVKQLISAGAKIDARNDSQSTALWLASGKGDIEIVATLLEHGANVDARNRHLETPLFTAAWNGHVEVVEQLITAGADPEFVSKKGKTAMVWAAQNSHVEVVKRLLTKGVSAQEELLQAANKGKYTTLKTLLKAGVDPTIRNNKGATILHIAAKKGYLNIVKLGIEYGIDVNSRETDKGYTALPLTKKIEIAQYLLSQGADINAHSNQGWTAFLLAAQQGRLDMLKFLYEQGFDVNYLAPNLGNDPWGVLMVAVQGRHLENIKFLVEHGATIDRATQSGWTALMIAAQSDYVEIIQYLHQQGAKINNITTHDGLSPLMVAIQAKRYQAIKYLVDNGAALNIKNDQGETALTLAKKSGVQRIINLLQQVESQPLLVKAKPL